jgi:hypothetical protein
MILFFTFDFSNSFLNLKNILSLTLLTFYLFVNSRYHEI